MLFRIVNGIVVIDADKYLTSLVHARKLLHQHSQEYIVLHSKSTEYQEFLFVICTVTAWNELSAHVVNSQTANAFCAHLVRSASAV